MEIHNFAFTKQITFEDVLNVEDIKIKSFKQTTKNQKLRKIYWSVTITWYTRHGTIFQLAIPDQ